jgi:hypothetical protein
MPQQDLPPDSPQYMRGPLANQVAPQPGLAPLPIAGAPVASNRTATLESGLNDLERRSSGAQPAAAPTSTPFLDRAAALAARAEAGIKNLIGDVFRPSPPPATTNVLAPRTGALDQLPRFQGLNLPTLPPVPPPIKPGAQPNILFSPKPNTTPAIVPTADKKDSLLDARFARKESGY